MLNTDHSWFLIDRERYHYGFYQYIRHISAFYQKLFLKVSAVHQLVDSDMRSMRPIGHEF